MFVLQPRPIACGLLAFKMVSHAKKAAKFLILSRKTCETFSFRFKQRYQIAKQQTRLQIAEKGLQ